VVAGIPREHADRRGGTAACAGGCEETPAAERSRIKTGTLRDVSAVAGYVKDDDGETYIVAAMLNHERAVKQVARPILDTLSRMGWPRLEHSHVARPDQVAVARRRSATTRC